MPDGFTTASPGSSLAERALAASTPEPQAEGEPDTVAQAAASGGAATAEARPDGTGAAPAWSAADVRRRDFATIQPGWNVVGADGDSLGPVDEASPGWLLLHWGANHDRVMYLGVQFIETVTNGRVVLNRPASLLKDMKLDHPPADSTAMQYERLSGIEHDPRGANAAGSKSVAQGAGPSSDVPVSQATAAQQQAGGAGHLAPHNLGAGGGAEPRE